MKKQRERQNMSLLSSSFLQMRFWMLGKEHDLVQNKRLLHGGSEVVMNGGNSGNRNASNDEQDRECILRVNVHPPGHCEE